MPLAPYLVRRFGDFVIIDATAKLTIYEGRQGIIISVVDNCCHAHPVSFTDVGGHREGQYPSTYYMYVYLYK